ncbi:hypothetical protein BLNAU_15120 [Blattamonas nauphoetae]|uniref:OTU domain-containing protein n=1 Tax=Blattamonas nauphoetae TaxID=2049346 RepID=A0ABQ9XH61_9EUKA|nr:hypothetical protein BLNAU_15120 [Blattamonas nauphoetae]
MGDCLFSSVSMLLPLSKEHSSQRLRDLAIATMEKEPQFQDLVYDEGSLHAHLDKLKQPYTWGDTPEIAAMALGLNRTIQVYLPVGEIQSHPSKDGTNDHKGPLRLAYIDRNHYQPLFEKDHTPLETGPKQDWVRTDDDDDVE